MCRQICAIIVCPLYSSCSTFGEQLTLESTRVTSQALGLYRNTKKREACTFSNTIQMCPLYTAPPSSKEYAGMPTVCLYYHYI